MFYFMYVPAIVALMAAIVVIARTHFRAQPATNHRLRRAIACAVAFVSLYNLGVWVQLRSHPDDGLARTVRWFQTYVPDPGTIGNNTQVSTDLLTRSGFRAMNIADPQTAAQNHVRYLLILSSTLVGNYGTLTKPQASFFAHYGRLVFRYRDNTYHAVSVYETTDPAIW
jgi:hypothetical protein